MRRLLVAVCAAALLAPLPIAQGQAPVSQSGATVATAATQAGSIVAAQAKNDDKKKKRKKKSRKRARKARVVLGFHNYQQVQNSAQYLSRPHARHRARVNCLPLMTSSRQELQAMSDRLEGLPGLFSGCGSSPSSWKYKRGPMSGGAATPSAQTPGEPLGAATPTVRSYIRYMRRVKAVFGRQVEAWEVWNEVDLAHFYLGTPKDLVQLTFAAARVFGRKRVTAPSFSPTTVASPRGPSGAWVRGRFLTRGQLLRDYWRRLVTTARRRDVPLPVRIINVHTYGAGTSARTAARNRVWKAKQFVRAVRPILGARQFRKLQLWDTEWNLRRIDDDQLPPYTGFTDSRTNIRTWARSARVVACLGYDRQYTYVWNTEPAHSGDFTAGQLQMNPTTARINRAYRSLNYRRVRCA